MTEVIQLAPQHLGRGRPSKFVPKPLSVPLFAGAASRQLEADEALFVVGEPGDGCYQLKHGLLKVVISSPQGDERILAILGPGAIVGELAIIDRGPRSASVFAVRHCELSFISRAEFEERTTRHPEIYQYLMNVLAARLRQTNETVAAVSFLTVKARLARALLQLAELAGEDDGAGRVVIHHKIGQSDLAAMAGVARENVSRVMCDWKRRKVVTRSSGFYCLTDITTLKRNSFNGTWLRKPNGDERLGRSSPMSNARDNAETAPRFERSTLPGPANRLWQLQRAHSASRRPMSDDETKPPAPEEQALDKEALDGFRDYAPTAVEEAKYIVALAPEKPAQARSTPAAASRADGAEDTRQCRPLPLAFVLRSPHRRTASRLS